MCSSAFHAIYVITFLGYFTISEVKEMLHKNTGLFPVDTRCRFNFYKSIRRLYDVAGVV